MKPFEQQQQQQQPPPQQANMNNNVPVWPGFAHVPQVPVQIAYNEQQYALTAAQISARQAMPKDLPTFSEKAEEWPLFISAYYTTTQACNISDQENLLRLQRCLKGRALDSVRCRLLLPHSVSNVIETLRMMFGRPELIINTLLQKIRSEPPPKIEKLQTVVTFALAVQNLSSTMEASGLVAHLNNPTLLQELTDKLPPQIKINWAIYKQTCTVISISTFSEWLFQIAQAANDVTFEEISYFSGNNDQKQNRTRVNKHEESSRIASSSSSCQSRTDSFKTVKLTKCFICNEGNHEVGSCSKFLSLNLNERWQIVKKNKLCSRCFGLHNIRKCSFQSTCSINECQKSHNPLLHNGKSNETSTNVTNEAVKEGCLTHHLKKQHIMFRVIPITLYSNDKTIDTFAFLDEGSSLTLMEESIADELGLSGPNDSLCLKWTGNTLRTESNSRRVSVSISGKYNNAKRYIIQSARTVEKLSLPTQSVDSKELAEKYPHLKDVPFIHFQEAVPTILIGLDNWKLRIPLFVREGRWQEPVATKTRLGWVIHGVSEIRHQPALTHRSYHMCECKVENDLHKLVTEFFSLENFGIKASLAMESNDDKRAKEILESSTKKTEKSYETGLLWRYKNVKLPPSYEMAKRRLICLENKMLKNKDLYENLRKQIDKYIIKRYAKKLSPV